MPVKEQYFDRELVQLVAKSFAPTLDRFKAKLEKEVGEGEAKQSWKIVPAPPQYHSMVVEAPFDLTLESVGLAGVPNPRPFRFGLEVHFGKEAELWHLGGLPEKDPLLVPWNFPTLDQTIAASVPAWAAKNPWRDQVMHDIAEFIVLQRLFRMGLDGHLGQGFPLEQLGRLAREVAGAVEKVRTPRTDFRP